MKRTVTQVKQIKKLAQEIFIAIIKNSNEEMDFSQVMKYATRAAIFYFDNTVADDRIEKYINNY